MVQPTLRPTNFAILQEHDEQLVRLGILAEKYFAEDPNTCIMKMRQFAEVLAQLTAARAGVYYSPGDSQFDLLRRLQEEGVLNREIFQVFSEIRRLGNNASHEIRGDHGTALSALKLGWQAGVWFHRTFGSPRFKAGPFIPPAAPTDEREELRAEIARLNQTLSEYQSTHGEASQRLERMEAKRWRDSMTCSGS